MIKYDPETMHMDGLLPLCQLMLSGAIQLETGVTRLRTGVVSGLLGLLEMIGGKLNRDCRHE